MLQYISDIIFIFVIFDLRFDIKEQLRFGGLDHESANLTINHKSLASANWSSNCHDNKMW